MASGDTMDRLDLFSASLVAALCIASAAAQAQGYPGGSRNRQGGGGMDRPPGADQAKARGPMQVADPLAALERELPSLRVDLKLTPEQGALWDSFERGVRDVADMSRARLRRGSQPVPESEKPASAQGMLFAWSEDERVKADAMATLTRKFDALYSQLNSVQRLEVDRRFALSQSDPLGVR
jgi:hypothetical protein